MKRKATGRFVTISVIDEKCKAFIPDPLPPVPALNITADLRDQIDRAILSLGRLDSAARFLPDSSLFLDNFIRKEAVVSSQIEGTQSSLSDLLLFEMEGMPGVPIDDVQEVSNYVAAVNHGMKRLRENFPISLRLMQEIHSVLLAKGRGASKNPGEFRTSQNWIGCTRPGHAALAPPPPDKLMECLGALEMFLHDQPEKTPPLIKAALAHAQFETLHPFLDGNGRLGRLLIALLLCAEGILREPMLCLSLYFKTHRDRYDKLLQSVRKTGDWEEWIRFFATAVQETADQAVGASETLAMIAQDDREKIRGIGRSAGSGLRVHQAFQERPILSIPKACEMTGLWATSVIKVVKHLERIGLIKECTGRKRNRLFAYTAYLDVLNQGTEPR